MEDTNRVTIATTWIKELSIPLSQIESRTILAAPSVPGTNAVGGVATTNGLVILPGTNAVAGSAGTTNLALVKTGPPSGSLLTNTAGWHGEVQIGTDLTYASTSRQLYYARAKLTYAKNKLKNVIDLSAAYGKSEGVTTDNRLDGNNKTDLDLSGRLYAYNLTDSGYDKIQLVRFRFEEGPGLGYHLWRTNNKVLNVELGTTYQFRELMPVGDDHILFGRVAENFTWKLNNRLTFDEKFEFLPQLEKFGHFQARFEANAHYFIMKNLTLNFTIIDSYDTDPAPGAEHYDTLIRSTVGLNF